MNSDNKIHVVHEGEDDVAMPRLDTQHRGPIDVSVVLIVVASLMFVFMIMLTFSYAPKIENNLTQTKNNLDTLSLKVQSSVDEVANLRQFVGSKTAEDVIFLKIMILKPKIGTTLANTIAKHIHTYSKLYGKDPDLVLSIIMIESDFNPDAISNKGATGLMQIMPFWKKSLGITTELKDPETSIKYGMQILSFYEETYKDLALTLTAYNRGPGTVDYMLARDQDPKTDYAPRIIKTYNKLKRIRSDGFSSL